MGVITRCRLAALACATAFLLGQSSALWAAQTDITRNAPASVSTPEVKLPERPGEGGGVPTWLWIVGAVGALGAVGLALGGGGGGGDSDPAPETGSIDVTF